MNKEVKDKWVTALRSFEYRQGSCVLNNRDKYFCCLGVLCELAAQEAICERKTNQNGNICYDEEEAYPPQSVAKWAGFPFWQRLNGADYKIYSTNPSIEGYLLSQYNDQLNKSFNEIADLIEAHL